MSETDHELYEEQLNAFIAKYQQAAGYEEMMDALKAIGEMAQQTGYVGALYVLGTALLGEGPCGGELLDKDSDTNREHAREFLQRAHELGDPIAYVILERHNLLP